MIEDALTLAHDVDDGCTLPVRVRPGAKKNDVAGIHAGAVKISLTAPPVDGRANEALIEFVAELLRIPRARVNLLSGATSRMKVLRITGKSAAEVQAALFPVELC
jgi:TIGR00251 family protein